MPSAQQLFFPPFRLDLVNERLWRGTQLLLVRPKTFAVLRYLVEHPGRLVTRDELRQAVWPDTHGSARRNEELLCCQAGDAPGGGTSPASLSE